MDKVQRKCNALSMKAEIRMLYKNFNYMEDGIVTIKFTPRL